MPAKPPVNPDQPLRRGSSFEHTADAVIIAGLCLLVLALRFATLFRPEINMDDSNFMVMGRTWLNGGTPYVDFWDHNPLGGVLLFGVAGRLFGYSVTTLRVLTIVAVALECVLLYLLGSRLGRRSRWTGVIAAAIYAVYSLNNLGQGADRIFFHAPLVTLAFFWLAARPSEPDGWPAPPGAGRLLAIGVLLAASMQLKYLFPVDYVPIILLVAWETWRRLHRNASGGSIALRIARDWALLIAPAVVLLAGNLVYFAARGLLDPFLHANFTANAVYNATTPLTLRRIAGKFAVQFSQNPLAWLGLPAAALYLFWGRPGDRRERTAFAIVGCWFGLALLIVLAGRRMDGHHFLQALPALALLAGLSVSGILRTGRPERTLTGSGQDDGWRAALLVLLILLGALYSPSYLHFLESARAVADRLTGEHAWPHDENTDVAGYLAGRVRPGESLFVVDYNPVIYLMVDQPVATPYTLPVYLIDEWYEAVLGKNQVAELDKIMAKRPVWVVVQARANREFTSQAVAARLAEHLSAGYTLDGVVPGVETYTYRPVDVQIYRRKD